VWFLLLAACTLMPYHRPSDTTLAPPPAQPAALAAVDVSTVLARVDTLLASADSVDERDRLVELRELVLGAAAGEPTLRARVLRYVERVVSIEERSAVQAIEPVEMAMATDFGAVVEAELEEPPAGDVAAVEAEVAAGHWEAALAALDAAKGIDPTTAGGLRKRCADGWSREEREGAAADFLKAAALPAGPERRAAVEAVKARLENINARFPDNVVADDVRRHVATVDAELKQP
jgi:hypothetical protein